MLDFVNLHTHTKYSLQDGLTEPEGLMKKCNDFSMKAVGVSDHGNMAGAWDCFKYADKYDINLVIGNEFYVVPDVIKSRGADWRRGKSQHICLHAADNRGWENLLQLTAKSHLIGFYNEPRIDYAMLKEHSDGLWCMSGCLGGPIAKAIKNGGNPRFAADRLYSIFGDRFSLEIQVNPYPEQEILNNACIKIHKATGIPLVATIDAHYLDKTDSHRQDMLFAMQLGKDLNDPNRLKMPQGEHSVETPSEAITRFETKYGKLGLQACARTVEIADNTKVDFTHSSRNYKTPTLDVIGQPDWTEFLKWHNDCECHSHEGTCLTHGSDCSHEH